MHPSWCNLRKWPQDKTTNMHFRVRHGQEPRVHHGVVVQQQIEIERAWTFLDAVSAVAPVLLLNRQQHVQQGMRFHIRLKDHGAIQKPRLIQIAHRICLKERGDRDDATKPPKRGERRCERGGTVAQVGPETDGGEWHGQAGSGEA